MRLSAPTDPSQPFGNATRNSVRGPLFWQVDLRVGKRVSMPWSSGSLELRTEFFNLLKPVELPGPESRPQRGGVQDDHADLRAAAGAAGGHTGDACAAARASPSPRPWT